MDIDQEIIKLAEEIVPKMDALLFELEMLELEILIDYIFEPGEIH